MTIFILIAGIVVTIHLSNKIKHLEDEVRFYSRFAKDRWDIYAAKFDTYDSFIDRMNDESKR